MFQSVEELPPQVRMALYPEQQTKWMQYANECESDKARCAWQKLKDEDKDIRWFEGFASVQIRDGHSTVFNVDALMRAMPKYIESGGEFAVQHRSGSFGHIYDYEMREDEQSGKPGLYVRGVLYRGQHRYDRLWEAISMKREKDGRLPIGMSIFAYANPTAEWICDAEKCEEQLITEELKEISLTYNPSNPNAKGYANGEAREDDAEDNDMSEDKKEEMREETPQEDGSDPLAELTAIVQAQADKLSALEAQVMAMGEMLESMKPVEEPPAEEPEPMVAEDGAEPEPEPIEEEPDEEGEMRAKTAEVLQSIDDRLKALERTALVQTSPIKTPVPHARVESFQTEAPDVVKSLKAGFLGGI